MIETPPCRTCGKNEDVAQFRPDRPGETVCTECCAATTHDDGETGHVFKYDRAERTHVCDRCGQFAQNTDFYDGWDQP